MKKQEVVEVKLNKIIYGGQALGKLEDGKKIMVWGGLPDELVKVKITKNKRNWAEGIVYRSN
jgi:23S rRNA (uracil1939-C5)-methyltransferase